jgi:hypothetical protein
LDIGKDDMNVRARFKYGNRFERMALCDADLPEGGVFIDKAYTATKNLSDASRPIRLG